MTILLCDLYYYILQVLSDQDKRSLYDRFGEEGLSGDYRNGDIGTHGVHNLFSTKSFSFLTSLIIILEYKSIFLSLLIRANLLGVRRGEWGRDLDWGRDLNR
jgi:DnaJ-class molecular chaperone